MKRKVKIELINGTYFVLYADRKKYQKKAYALFDSRYSTKEQVIEYVTKKNEVELLTT